MKYMRPTLDLLDHLSITYMRMESYNEVYEANTGLT